MKPSVFHIYCQPVADCCKLAGVALLLWLLSAVPGYSQTQDAAAWITMDLQYKISKRLDAYTKTQMRINENFTQPHYTYLDMGAEYAPGKRWAFATGVSFNFKNEGDREREPYWSFRQQWYGSITYDKRFGQWRIANRNQLQSDLEDQRSAEGSWFYRNKTSLRREITDNWSIQASWEGYLRIGYRPPEEDFLHRTRYVLVVKRDTGKQQSLDIGYMLQRQIRRSQPDYIHALLVTWTKRFK